MTHVLSISVCGLATLAALASCTALDTAPTTPYVFVLGTAQDGGSPQLDSPAEHPARLDPDQRRLATCLGIVDPATGGRWLLEATPDLREQAWALARAQPPADTPVRLDGVFLTHAHIGHYAGLLFLGHESMGARRVPVYAAPRMSGFLRTNGPWDQLVRYENVELRPLEPDTPVEIAGGISLTPFLVPHRQEYSEVLGLRIDGPQRSVVFLPDIDAWDRWQEESGVDVIDVVRSADRAYLDATFHDDDELPGRDMSGFPHPRIVDTMDRLSALDPSERAKVRFIHLNHTNPAQWSGSAARREIERRGFGVAVRGETFGL
jgi:pyrroloquinoline quinone biosynthesis protein B